MSKLTCVFSYAGQVVTLPSPIILVGAHLFMSLLLAITERLMDMLRPRRWILLSSPACLFSVSANLLGVVCISPHFLG